MKLYKITTPDDHKGLHKVYYVQAPSQGAARVWFDAQFAHYANPRPIERIEVAEDKPMALLQVL